jgi:hypothetical protein
VSTVQTYKSVSELTTCPRLGEDCWSRGLQSACFWQVAGWRVVHPGASLVDAHRFAPPLALGNRDLHALPWELGESSVVGLASVLNARAPSAAVGVAATAGHRVSSPLSGVGARAQRPSHG